MQVELQLFFVCRFFRLLEIDGRGRVNDAFDDFHFLRSGAVTEGAGKTVARRAVSVRAREKSANLVAR